MLGGGGGYHAGLPLGVPTFPVRFVVNCCGQQINNSPEQFETSGVLLLTRYDVQMLKLADIRRSLAQLLAIVHAAGDECWVDAYAATSTERRRRRSIEQFAAV